MRLDSNFSDGSWAIGSSKLINSELGRAYTERSTWGRGKQDRETGPEALFLVCHTKLNALLLLLQMSDLWRYTYSQSAPCEPFLSLSLPTCKVSNVLQRIFYVYYAHVNGWVWHSWLFFSVPFYFFVVFFLCRRKREHSIEWRKRRSFFFHSFYSHFYLFLFEEIEEEEVERRDQQLVPS